MMGKMVKNMIYFVVLLLVVLMSFGVSRQSILNPHEEADWRLVRDVFFQPYFMLYGEVFADDIDPPCGENPDQKPCLPGQWITPIAMAMYLLIANILLINLLIAVFNNIFNETNSISHQVWMFQRFTVVMEYQQKPVLPPPLIAFCHFYSLLKYCIRKTKNLKEVRDNGLKLFLERDDLEKLYDFEEECVEGYFHEQNNILLQSTEERIKNTDERVETMTQKIEDINIKENLQSISVQNMEFRLRKMEESTDQILSHLAVIHRFMSTHISSENVHGSMANIHLPIAPIDNRIRTVSENDTSNSLVLAPQPRFRKLNRSMTEVRPDAYIFDEGLHFEVRSVLKESEEILNSSEEIDLPAVIRQRKLSVQSEEPEFVTSPSMSQRPSIDIPLSVEPPIDFIPRSDSMSRRPPTLSVRQETKETTTSAESRDTLTPLEICDDRTLVGDHEETDGSYEGLRQRVTRRRNSQVGRRNSESHNIDINRSQTSLNYAGNPMHRRQFSLTQSEPDTDADAVPIPKPSVKSGRHLLLQIHAEYTSITDELESMIASPTNSHLDEKPKNINELSNPEFAALIEKKHLKECEDDDYMIMERLLQTRCSIDESDENLEEGGGFASDYSNRRMLRRETAIELPLTPSKKVEEPKNQQEYHVRNERIPSISRNVSSENNKLSPLSASNQNSPRNSRAMTGISYLNPDADHHQRFYKKSSESLTKNSSTETDYSAHPYRVIKQNSNDTNSSLNIDNSFTCDLSLDDPNMNATVIEPTAEERGMPKRAQTMSCATETRPTFLRKQFSIDCKRLDNRPQSENLEFRSTVKTHESSQQLHCPILPPRLPSTSRLHMNVLKESSSTESTRDDLRKMIPSISTHLVQDEIAKLSSNIKGSTDDEVTNDEPINETMC
jgi:transient receptor potential cation channel subfamily M member 3